ncbi:hypothetical protein GCM10022289_07830 [Pedobacter jeongneungensis]|uniref:Uncharacterized protein n=1 Tax=Pedobacter jeongneungensis TaxID=947309 RepID=A0ABP8B5P3_9SPHI
MATYNWKYKGGSFIKYYDNTGLFVANSDDDVKPDNIGYVALFGNDETGNGSRNKPWRTISKGCSTAIGEMIIVGSGVYRETVQGFLPRICGDGDVILDGTGLDYCVSNDSGGNNCVVIDVTMKNAIYYASRGPSNYYRCRVENTGISNFYGTDNIFTNITVYNGNNALYPAQRSPSTKNNTFVDCKFLNLFDNFTNVDPFNIHSNIFKRCNLLMDIGSCAMKYSILQECNVALAYAKVPNTLYPTTEAGWTKIDSLQDLKDLFAIVHPSLDINEYFENCIVADPKFNNIEIGDYSLAFDSPAKNASYFGTYIGAKSIGYPIKARAIEAESDFDFSTAVNLSITDNSIMLINPEIDASIETKVTANLKGRELAEAPIFGFNADRSGQYIDSLADLSEETISVGTSLKDLTPYIVEVASIILNGNIYQPGERFTTKDVLDFSSDGGGVCREILEAPQRHTIMARFSNGGASKSVSDPLVVGYWYYPISGTINYNGVEYFQKSFKAIDTNSFTTPDSGVLVEAFTNEEYQHYEPGIAFSSNNVGNVRTGEILRGNGDPDYVRGTAFEFPINARFIQLKYIIRVKNLKP